MNILILTSGIDSSATGIVTGNIIKGLIANDITTHVLTEKSTLSFESTKNSKLFKVDYKKIYQSSFFTELCILIFKFPLNEIGFILKAKKIAVELNKIYKYDVIMVLSSASGLHLLEAGVVLKHNLKIPLYIHATDPIPAPIPWYNTQSLRNALIKTAKRSFKKADLISLSNQYMLDYQNLIMNTLTKPSFVAHNPVSLTKIKRVKGENTKKIFLYVGSIYHQRQPDVLIKAFEVFALNNNVELWFLGNNKKLDLTKYNLNQAILDKIKILDFVKDPSKIIEKADVLIDFDANFENDVFISSKLITYLNTNIPILCLTPKNSPTDNLLVNSEKSGIVKMYYDQEDKMMSFLNALKYNSELSTEMVDNRDKLLIDFDKNNIGKKIKHFIESII